MLDFTFLLPFSLTEDDQKSWCVVNNSSQIEIVSKLGSHSFFFQIISTGAWDYCKLLHQCWITPSFAYLSTTHSLCNILSFHWTKNKKNRGEKLSKHHTFSFPSHLVSAWILTTQSDSSTSCYIRGLEAKGMEEVKQAQETAKRKTSLKLSWIGDTYLFVLFYASEFLWNREEQLWSDPLSSRLV